MPHGEDSMVPYGTAGLMVPEGDARGMRRPLADIFAGLLSRLESEATERVSRRQLVEERWLRDLQQYEGRDDDGVLARLVHEGRSTATVNVTRAKCNTFESKLFDMLFPTDDKNWGIEPTPVPEMDRAIDDLKGEIDVLIEGANVEEDDAQAEEMGEAADLAAQRLAELEQERQKARQRSSLMEAEIEDNLTECEYPIQSRKVIHEATVLGAGIMKGPVPLSERIRRSWLMEDGGKWRLQFDPESPDRFAYQATSCWNMFPDTAARDWGQVESWMERFMLRRRDLVDIAKQDGVDPDAVREVLKEGPSAVLPDYLVKLDTVVEEEQSNVRHDQLYIMWEYRGPLDEDEMQAVLMYLMEREGQDYESALESMPEIDPLAQLDAVVWFCQGHILKMGVNMLDDNSPMYSVFEVEKSPARLWSVGIPYLMRTQTDTINDAWRAMLDNADHAAFPQTEINLNVVQRTEGADNVIEPRGAWERLPGAGNEPGLIFHDVPIHQEHYQQIIELALRFIDIETNISVLASGRAGRDLAHGRRHGAADEQRQRGVPAGGQELG